MSRDWLAIFGPMRLGVCLESVACHHGSDWLVVYTGYCDLYRTPSQNLQVDSSQRDCIFGILKVRTQFLSNAEIYAERRGHFH